METPKTTVFQFYSADVPYSIEKEVMLDVAKQLLDMIYTESIRESEGGTYGVGVATLLREEPKEIAALQISFETNPEQASKLAPMTAEGIRGIIDNGIDAAMLAKVVENFKKNIPEQRISNYYWMSILKEWSDKGIDYDKEYEKAVSSITAEKVISVLKSVVDSGNYVEIIMSPEE